MIIGVMILIFLRIVKMREGVHFLYERSQVRHEVIVSALIDIKNFSDNVPSMN